MVSVVIAFTFLALATSGLMLFLSPPGRIANWTDWTLLGLSKSEWTAVHVWFSTLFLAITVFHIIYNWRPLIAYFKDRATRHLSLRREWLAALGLCAAIGAGTLAAVPPFSSLLEWNESFKESWGQPVTAAPIPHAELLTLAQLAEKAAVPLATAVGRLEARGITGSSGEAIVQDVAARAHLSPQQVYDIIRTSKAEPSVHGPGAGGGPGWKTLSQFCTDEGISVDDGLARLAAKGFKAEAGLTLREIATNNGLAKPYELLEVIRGK